MLKIGREIDVPKYEPIWHDQDDTIWHDLPLASYPEQDNMLASVFCRCGSTNYIDAYGQCAYCYLKWGRQLEEYDENGFLLFRAG